MPDTPEPRPAAPPTAAQPATPLTGARTLIQEGAYCGTQKVSSLGPRATDGDRS